MADKDVNALPFLSFLFQSVQGANNVVETLYRNKSSLEAIFRIIDKDNSGFITLEEFSDACNLIKEHMPNPITQDQLKDICRLMDMNKDGLVDLNEFLETFRMVDPEQRKNLMMMSSEDQTPYTNGTLAQSSPKSVSPSNVGIISHDVLIEPAPKSVSSPTKQQNSINCNSNTLTMSPVLSCRQME